jgi:hypothetical protein
MSPDYAETHASRNIREFKQGVLPNGESIAVKKLNSSMPGVKDKQF